MMSLKSFTKDFQDIRGELRLECNFCCMKMTDPHIEARLLFYYSQIHLRISLTIQTHLKTIFLPSYSKKKKRKKRQNPPYRHNQVGFGQKL